MKLMDAIDKMDINTLRMILRAIVKEFPLIREQLMKVVKESKEAAQ